MQSAVSQDLVLSRNLRIWLWILCIGMLFLTQIAYMIGSFPVAVPLILYFATIAYFAAQNLLTIRIVPLTMLTVAGVIGLLGLRHGELVSSSSFLMTITLYLPFVFDCKDEEKVRRIRNYFCEVYIAGVTVIALVAIVQFALMNVVGLTSLVNVYYVLPAGLHEAGGYAYFRPMAGLLKANGYFLRESSFLSMYSALALLMEYFGRARFRALAILALALFLSFSGTGAMIIIFAVLVPRSRQSLRIAGLLGVAAISVYFWGDKIPGVGFWVARLAEFQAAGSSGYARFVAPFLMLQTTLANKYLLFFGNGPGSYDRTVRPLSLLLNFQIAGASLPKNFYEYGLIGCAMINGLVARRVYRSDLRWELKNVLFLVWLLFVVNLGEDFLLVWLLTSWQRRFDLPSRVSRVVETKVENTLPAVSDASVGQTG